MIRQLLPVRKDERRAVGLLGCYIFLMLAATTMAVTASDALFVTNFGADQLPIAIALAQITAIVGFYGYRGIRAAVRASLITPVTVLCLSALAGALYAALVAGESRAVFAFVVLVPLFQGILSAEYSRLAANLVDARSARRLLPVLGSIGGAGAALGAYLVSWVSSIWTQIHIVPVMIATLLLLVLPAAGIRESMRPRSAQKPTQLRDVAGNRYVLVILAGAALIIALSTVVRTQFGAMVKEQFDGDEIAIFYGNFHYALNLTSIVFSLFLSGWIINRLGAAQSLLLYPTLVGITAAVGTVVPGLIATSVSQFLERLIRQNVHNTVSAITGMPVPAPSRVRMMMLSSGVVRPVAVLVTSGALLLTFGERSILARPLTWPDLYWPIAILCVALLGLMLYLRRRYPQALYSALHARRLQLEPVDEDSQHALPMDRSLRSTLHGYLASELPERTDLALKLLLGQADAETRGIIRHQWPLWADWLRLEAAKLLLDSRDDASLQFLLGRLGEESDTVQGALIGRLGADLSDQHCEEMLAGNSGPLAQAALLALLASRGKAGPAAQLQAWLDDGTLVEHADVVARTLVFWPDNRFDAVLPKLLPAAPGPSLQVIARRPTPEMAGYCVPYLGRDEYFAAARAALLAIGEPAVSPLEKAAADTTAPSAAAWLIMEIEGRQAHLAGMRLMAHPQQPVRNRACKARLASPLPISEAETQVAGENSEEALDRARRFHAYRHQSEGVAREVAASEREAALEDLFLALSLSSHGNDFRQIYLACTAADSRQRSFALELLEERLSIGSRRTLFPILEDEPPRKKLDMRSDREWLELEERLHRPVVGGLDIAGLKTSKLFGRWRLAELETLTAASDGESRDDRNAILVLRDGNVIGLPRLLLTGNSPEPLERDIVLPLTALYRALTNAPRCGKFLLESLAAAIPEPSRGSAEVTRSSMVSLASRTLGEDEQQASDLAVWQRMFFLRSSPLGQDLPPARLRLLAEVSRSLNAPAGTTVFHEGRLGQHFYLVCTGSLEVLHQGEVIAQLGPADGFGALALMRGLRRPMSVRASEDCELIAISRVDFLDMIECHPAMVRSFARMLAAQIMSLQESAGALSEQLA